MMAMHQNVKAYCRDHHSTQIQLWAGNALCSFHVHRRLGWFGAVLGITDPSVGDGKTPYRPRIHSPREGSQASVMELRENIVANRGRRADANQLSRGTKQKPLRRPRLHGTISSGEPPAAGYQYPEKKDHAGKARFRKVLRVGSVGKRISGCPPFAAIVVCVI